MLRRLGYVGISLSIDASTNRTARLRNATPERLRQLIAENLVGLETILNFNLRNGIYLFRISSQIIPFASHPVNTIRWWEEFGDQLARLGEFVRQHDMRVSMHPAQYAALSAVRPAVLDAALLDVEWHVRFLDSMGLDRRHKIVLHIGGAYGNKTAAKKRFIDVTASLPPTWRRRLVLENDERTYAVDDVLEVSHRTGLPVVFDYFHHQINPGNDDDLRTVMRSCFNTWRQSDGIPKIHYSDQEPGGRPGTHSDWIDPEGFIAFLRQAPDQDFDCMLEAKKKDLALFKLRSDLARRSLGEGQAA
ncbi:MAG: UV DNA damage repair endonuclease UvsE [Chloroflexota bacterium]